jgi:DUF917 family protein
MERVSRKICVEMGSIASTCKAPRTGREVKEWGIHFTVSKAIGIGRRVREAQRRHEDPITAILDEAQGKQLFRGKVVDVERRATEGFLRGRCAIEGLDEDRGARLEIAFQNEWVVAWRAENSDPEPIAMSPDLICVLDTVSGNAFGTETIRYGMRVTVVALPAPPVFLTPKGLDHVGPRAFGYDLDFRSVFDTAPIEPSPPFRGRGRGPARSAGRVRWACPQALWNPPPHPDPLRRQGRRGRDSASGFHEADRR